MVNDVYCIYSARWFFMDIGNQYGQMYSQIIATGTTSIQGPAFSDYYTDQSSVSASVQDSPAPAAVPAPAPAPASTSVVNGPGQTKDQP